MDAAVAMVLGTTTMTADTDECSCNEYDGIDEDYGCGDSHGFGDGAAHGYGIGANSGASLDGLHGWGDSLGLGDGTGYGCGIGSAGFYDGTGQST